MKKQSFKILDMHCTSCAMIIESDLEDQGVKARCSYAKAMVEVEYDAAKITEEVIIATIKEAGYTVGK